MIWSHDALAADLGHHLKTDERLVWLDMQIGPAGSPRPDVFTLQRSYSRPAPAAYECKISTADFRRDITEGKWQKYLEFSGAVTFAVPQGLVRREDIPTGCGFMVRGEDAWVTIKRATRQVSQLKSNHLMKLLIDGYSRELSQIEDRRRVFTEIVARDKIAKKYGKEVGEVLRDIESGRMLVAHYKREQEKTRERTAKIAEEIKNRRNESWEKLCRVLGLPADSSNEWDAQQKIRDIQKKAEDREPVGEIVRLKGIIRSVSRAIAEAET